MPATQVDRVLSTARAALRQAPSVGDARYHRFAKEVGYAIKRHWHRIEEANASDITQGRARSLPEPLVRRIQLTEKHRDAMLALADAVPVELDAAVRRGHEYHGIGGARARRMLRPLGVILMIYEARPTVTVDGSLLPVCAGNAVLLRGGSEIANTNAVLAEILAEALAQAGLPGGLVQIMHDLDRTGLRELLRRDDAIDVLVPRGSPSLVDSCRALSRIPMIVGGGGVNHQYIHASADLDLAARLVLDGKLPEPEGCTALESVLLDEAIVEPFGRVLTMYVRAPDVRGLTLRADATFAAHLSGDVSRVVTVEPLVESDLGREFLDQTLAAVTVPGLPAAIAHIERYGSGHTEGIVTQDPAVADEFCRRVDAAAVIVNGSIRLHDGPSLGLGSEIVISTGRLHVRGPVTIVDLMSRSWRVDGNGAVRFRTA